MECVKMNKEMYKYEVENGLLTWNKNIKPRLASGFIGNITINVQLTASEVAQIQKKFPELTNKTALEIATLKLFGIERKQHTTATEHATATTETATATADNSTNLEFWINAINKALEQKQKINVFPKDNEIHETIKNHAKISDSIKEALILKFSPRFATETKTLF